MTSPVIYEYIGPVPPPSASRDSRPAVPASGSHVPRQAFYGITEIAAALDVDRQLVTAWRRRGSHAFPEPDAELSSGPIWRGESVEPWIDARLASRGDGPVSDASPADASRVARRVLRCAALALEDPVRPPLLARALTDVDEAARSVERREGPVASAVRDVLAAVGPTTSRPLGRAQVLALRAGLVAALPLVARLVATDAGPLDGGGAE